MALKQVGKRWVDLAIAEVHKEHAAWLKLVRQHEHQKLEKLRLVECCTGLVVDSSSSEEREQIHTIASKDNQGYLQMTPAEMQIYYKWRNGRDGRPKKEAHVIIMTKEFVDKALAANQNNRKPRQTHIAKFRRLLARGHWCVTSQGIGFDLTGRLIDGQQRLMAIRDAGYPPVKLVVVNHLSVLSRIYIDSLLAIRKALDHLKFSFGVTNMDGKAVATCRCNIGWIQRASNCSLKIESIPATAIEATEIYPWHLARRWAFERIWEVKGAVTLPAPILGAFLDMLFATGDTRILNMLNLVMERPANVPANTSVWALRDFIDRWKGKLNGGWSSQRMRYYAAAEAILSYMEGDTKLFKGDMLDHSFQTLTQPDIDRRRKCFIQHAKPRKGQTVRERPINDPLNGKTNKRDHEGFYRPATFVRN